jgi:hypothetical protein
VSCGGCELCTAIERCDAFRPALCGHPLCSDVSRFGWCTSIGVMLHAWYMCHVVRLHWSTLYSWVYLRSEVSWRGKDRCGGETFGGWFMKVWCEYLHVVHQRQGASLAGKLERTFVAFVENIKTLELCVLLCCIAMVLWGIYRGTMREEELYYKKI